MGSRGRKIGGYFGLGFVFLRAYKVLIAVYLGTICYFMILAHPLQNVYFNETLTSIKADQYFDIDYYCLSYREGIEYLLEKDKDDTIRVAYSGFSGSNNEFILTEEQKRRLKTVPLSEAEYFLTNYYKNATTYDQIANVEFPYNQKPIYTIIIQGNTVLGICNPSVK